ncbi:glucose/arabinose dehydrogenase [Kineosphaera limosa]|uniref:Putative soluble aldose sugar dehydrogenase n=1 Tax=Kineosphaera limosa NBRC 100340 TaxID=1184609 RepID=K6X612_9MICO|nr:PQQ-dependent sugar dehydrogenase [Kineosphaera limosa]NYE02813.1 glucose/arabinose dehydrogenase [Kineosphaera limosa]GAB94244.1 putative soluble aldose sugar dehydrogenase [Kineosphaera limosa NBRC 100340]
MSPRTTTSLRTPRALIAVAALGALGAVAGCADGGTGGEAAPGTPGAAAPATPATPGQTDQPRSGPADPDDPFVIEEVASISEPWAMTFLPDGTALITQRSGTLAHFDPATGQNSTVTGTPQVVHAGQGGLGDVVLAPDFEQSRHVYLSWAESGDGGSGAAVGRATLAADSSALEGLEVIWRQEPKDSGNGHYGHRMAFSPDGQHLFVTSGDRQKLDPAQDLGNTLGTIVRLNPDGSPAQGNPFADRGGVSAQIWSYGHRNPLGIAFDPDGNLWSTEMGPRGGDELNLITQGQNYGWPSASQGRHYSGQDIPDHADGDGFTPPAAYWVPAISPGNLLIYTGEQFADWQGDALIGGLSGQSISRVQLEGTQATKANEWDMGQRIRELEQGPDGAIWALTDGNNGQILKLTPKA